MTQRPPRHDGPRREVATGETPAASELRTIPKRSRAEAPAKNRPPQKMTREEIREAAHELAERSAREQGLPPTITDPACLAQVVALMRRAA